MEVELLQVESIVSKNDMTITGWENFESCTEIFEFSFDIAILNKVKILNQRD
jgi:hypothetical protein